MNPSVTAPPVAGIFFPLRPGLRLDSHGFSPASLGKIVRAAARNTSFATAAESLRDEAEITFSERPLQRIAHEIGDQLQQDRDRRVEAFQEGPPPPEVPVVPRLAVVFLDGGRLQVRSEEAGRGPGVSDPAWREDKVANLELPRCFTQKRQVIELVQGVTGRGASADVVDPGDESPPTSSAFEPHEDEPAER